MSLLCIYICVTGMKMGSETRRQKTELNHTFVTNGYLAWMLVGVQMNHGGLSTHAQCFSH